MKRYLLFMYMTEVAWEDTASTCPGGGWFDFEGDFDTTDEAKTHALELYRACWNDQYPENEAGHIVDTHSMNVIETCEAEENEKLRAKTGRLLWEVFNPCP